METNRKLAAIMFTDIVGYSTMVHSDESFALQLLEEHRDIIRPFFKEFDGREIKTAGDSFLTEFLSALGATECAIRIQSALYERNEQVTDERKINIRIGIHLGDVIEKDNDVFGDGVNIAARIEPLAPAGGICISEDIWRQVQNKLEYGTFKMERKILKNIDLPFRIYAIDLPWLKKENTKTTGNWQGKIGVILKFRNPFTIGFGLALLAVLSFIIFNIPLSQTSFKEYTIHPLTSFEGIELNPSWSPDGSQIAFQSSLAGNTDIYTKSRGEGAVHNVTNSPYDEWRPSWSPDGRRIAYLSDRGNGTTLFSVPASGGAERPIVNTNIPISKLAPAIFSLGKMPWSPDSKELVFSGQKDDGTIQLWKVNIEDGTKHILTNPPPGSKDLSGSWSQDGKQIIFRRQNEGQEGVVSYDIESGKEDVIVKDDFNFTDPVLSPDNLFILHGSRRSGALNIWEYALDSKKFNQVTSGKGNDTSPVYTKGGEIAFAIWNHKINVFKGGIDDPIHLHTQLTKHTKEDFYPRASADGSKIIYQSERTENNEIWLYDTIRRVEIQLTKNSKTDFVPVWSRGGTEIIFVSDRDGPFQLWRMDADGKDQRKLTEDTIDIPIIPQNASNGAPRLSPDGNLIGYVVKNEEGPTLRIVQIDGNSPVETNIHGIISFDWYKDNDHIVYSKKANDKTAISPMYIRSISSGKESVLVDDVVTEICVSPDYKMVSYCSSISHFGQTINIIALDYDVKLEELISPLEAPNVFLSGKGGWHPHNGGWTPDGKQILYSKDTDEGDLYILKPQL